MRVLVVVAHPLDEAFAKVAARRICATLERRGIEVDLLDLYAEDFDPRLSVEERRGYFARPYDFSAVAPYVERLRAAEKLVLVFPQWWFDVPAILKGFFDRVFAPGVAFDHGAGGSGLVPRLTHMKSIWVVSMTGSPWWVTWLYVGNPVGRQIKLGVRSFVNPKAKFRMLSLHGMDRMTEARANAFLEKLERAFQRF
jgi:putative NADPH-quinone reductase